jgi:FMN reductase
MSLSTVVLSGNPRQGSRTTSLAADAARTLRTALDGVPLAEPRVIDLADFGPRLLAPTPDPDLVQAYQAVRGAGLLVVATPVYKASYTGLLKVFFDAQPGGALRDVVAVPVVVSASPKHALVADVHLRPLLVELGASVLTPALTVTEAELAEPDAVLGEWAAAAAGPARALLTSTAPALTR